MTSEDPGKKSSRRSRSQSIRAYVSDLICNADNEDEFDALQIIEKKPEIRQYPSLVLNLAYEEFCRKKEQGSPIQHRSFAQRFPGYEESLMRVLQVHQYLESTKAKKEKPKIDWPKPGDVFGGYRLIELIGRGSFAFVFIAEQLNVAGRKVVLKITRDALDEIATLGRLNHPHIVQIYTVESDIDGFTAICMPLISQVTLFDVMGELHDYGGQPESAEDFVNALETCISEREEIVLNRTTLPFHKRDRFVDAVLKVGVDITRALVYSHQQKFLHCDIKPTNILIAPDGKSMLFDFNLSSKSNSKSGRIGGTLPYMPPEQLQALVDSDFEFQATMAVDIYSLGVTLYQFLTGKLPFGDIPESTNQKETAELLLERQKNPRLSFAGVRGLNPSLKRLLASCLALDPQQRPHSAKELKQRLENEQKTFKRTRRWMVTHPVKSLVTCLTLLILIPGAIWSFHYATKVVPRNQIRSLIQQGRQSEAEYRFSPAIDAYQKALRLADIDPSLRHQVLCHLAIVYARHNKPNDAQKFIDLVNADFPLSEIKNAKVELAVIASGDNFAKKNLARAVEINQLLLEFNKRSLDDFNNYLSVEVSFAATKPDYSCTLLKPEFQKILDADARHFGANYNLYRIQRNENRNNKYIDEKYLNRCLKFHGDKPRLVSFLFKNEATRVNEGISSILDYVALARRFAKCGGRKVVATEATLRISQESDREIFQRQLMTIEFSGRDDDRFLHFGLVDPLNTQASDIGF